MRNRTRVIATAAIAVALAASSTAAAVASPADGTPSAPAVAKSTPAIKDSPARKAHGPDSSLPGLAAKLGVSQSRLDQALRTAKSSFRDSPASPTEDQFTAALARALGISVAQVRQAFPAGTPGDKQPGKGKIAAGGKQPGGSGPTDAAVAAALTAAVASALHVSTAQVSAALQPLFAAGRADPSTPAFQAAARSLGVSSQQLTTALVNAKMSLAKGQ